MKPGVFVLCLVAGAAAADAEPAAPAYRFRHVRFAGNPEFAPDVLEKMLSARRVTVEGLFGEGDTIVTSSAGQFPAGELCACLLDARRIAEAHGRLDFSADVVVADAVGSVEVVARVRMGSAHTFGRITFSGNYRVNESTLRRAMALRERDLFDIGRLRRGLARLNEMGWFEPLTLADVGVERHADGVTADLTIPLRERRRRWWSLSAPLVPGLGSFQASISSRLPAWGRGVFEASTYYVTFNLMGFANPLVQLLPFAWNARPATALVLERPPLPGQEWLSGFALSPTLSVRTMLSRYGGAHLARGVRAALREEAADAMGVPVTSGGRPDAGVLICEKPGPRLRWLRRGAIRAADLAMAAMLP